MTRPRPHQAALALVLAASAVLELYRLGQNSWANTYYSAAVKSMLGSLHNFLFVSSDPGGLVTVDKPPLGLWLQTLSAAIFGFHPLSLLIPEALCAIATVAVLYLIVAPRFGVWAGILAAAAMATFPSFVASGRDNNLDALLILLMSLACLSGLLAAERGSWRWLAATALLVGLAFNTKTLAAYLIVPGLALAWLVCAPRPIAARVRLLVAAAAVLAVASLAWVVVVEATPPSDRPYVGGTADNSEFSLSFLHNGFGRVLGERNAPSPNVVISPAPGSLRHSGGTASTGSPGPLRLFKIADGGQCAWLLPLAALGLLGLALEVRRRRRSNPRLALLLVMGGWFAIEALVLSFSSGIVHPYYVSALGPGTAAMVGAGAASMTGLVRRARGYLVLPALGLIGSLAVTLELLRREHDWLHWMWPVLIAIVVVALVMMAWHPRVSAVSIAVAVAVLLVPIALYSASTWEVPVNGTFPAAGPYIEDDTENLGIPLDQVPIYSQLLAYVHRRQPPSRWDLFTQGATTAAPLTLLGGRVAALGGYGTIDPVLTPPQLAQLVTDREVKFVALGGGYATRGGNAASTAVAAACLPIPASHWRSPQNIGTPGHPLYIYPHGGWNLQLYDCAGRTAALAREH
ncbi:MAG TPA: glycosyltransferase family 39 protein [Solirubrobacteraceae bacterium]|jgi:4-amino-4-deoxy-L-arabinose transferase-like glycosyltransferase|nr:glycosyltransferase family 39 protein [Solirubrobacteraceae bacterium]